MVITDSIVNFRRFLKRRNLSSHTTKNYINSLRHFVVWINVPIEKVLHENVTAYIDYLIDDKRLKPVTINAHMHRLRQFYAYLVEQEQVCIANPFLRVAKLRVPKPLPKHLQDSQAQAFLEVPKRPRDQAMFLLMLRCGLRVEEVANLKLDVIEFRRRRIWVQDGKGAKDRMVYVSNDAMKALIAYLKIRPETKTGKVFLVEKGTYKNQPISVRGIQKRMEYYAKKENIKISCHHLRHTMATQMLNAGAELETIQDLLGHSSIRTTQRYSRISNVKVQQDYHRAMDVVMQQTASVPL
ncbi:MAG: tyrosine-type recombinase/integrase [Planctomycetota bacterium]|jgi:site-specific recombinase XerD